MPTANETSGFRTVAILVGHWTTWRTNAVIPIGSAQGLSTEKRICSVSLNHNRIFISLDSFHDYTCHLQRYVIHNRFHYTEST